MPRPPDARGLYALQPRTAYYALRQAFRLPPYDPTTDLARIGAHFEAIVPEELAFHYKADKAAGDADWLSRVRLSNVYMKFETYSTGGNDNWQRPDLPPGVAKGFDTLQTFSVAAEVNPTDKVRAMVNVNVLGNVPLNPIDEIFYENRGRPITVRLPDDPATQEAVEDTIQDIERVKVYKASVSWQADYLDLEGFYHSLATHRPIEALLCGSVPVLNADELDIYDLGLTDGATCIAVARGGWPAALERILAVRDDEVAAMRRNIRRILPERVAYPALARSISERLGLGGAA